MVCDRDKDDRAGRGAGERLLGGKLRTVAAKRGIRAKARNGPVHRHLGDEFGPPRAVPAAVTGTPIQVRQS